MTCSCTTMLRTVSSLVGSRMSTQKLPAMEAYKEKPYRKAGQGMGMFWKVVSPGCGVKSPSTRGGLAIGLFSQSGKTRDPLLIIDYNYDKHE